MAVNHRVIGSSPIVGAMHAEPLRQLAHCALDSGSKGTAMQRKQESYLPAFFFYDNGIIFDIYNIYAINSSLSINGTMLVV